MKIFIGWDAREQEAYEVCDHSIRRHTDSSVEICPIVRSDLMKQGVYTRDQPEAGSVEFTYTRFLVPYLSNYSGWSLFVDCDFLFTNDVSKLFDLADDRFAAMCVKHDYIPRSSLKMDGQKQLVYPRKNWSSCVLWNCGHESNKVLTPELASSETGSYLHRFQFLNDDEIGELPLEWNWLSGEYDKPDEVPSVIHYTLGGPWFKECQHMDYADLWINELSLTKDRKPL